MSIALFIDGDNASPSSFESVYDQIKLKGTVSIRKLYTDLIKEPKKWNTICIDNGIELIHVPNLERKESSDMKMIVDIMDILHIHKYIDTFCIVSSDSDFSSVVMKLKQYNKKVIGIGEAFTPKLLSNICDEFIYLQKDKKTTKDIKQIKDTTKPNEYNLETKILDTFNSADLRYVCDITQSPYKPIEDIKKYPKSFIIKNDKIYIVKLLYKNLMTIKESFGEDNNTLSFLSDKIHQLDPAFSYKLWDFKSFSNMIEVLFNDIINITINTDTRTKHFEFK